MGSHAAVAGGAVALDRSEVGGPLSAGSGWSDEWRRVRPAESGQSVGCGAVAPPGLLPARREVPCLARQCRLADARGAGDDPRFARMGLFVAARFALWQQCPAVGLDDPRPGGDVRNTAPPLGLPAWPVDPPGRTSRSDDPAKATGLGGAEGAVAASG